MIRIPVSQSGISLLEVLIALVVLSIGLLGLASLQTVSLQYNQSALVRSQASNLAYDITERMRANWASLGGYELSFADPTPAASTTNVAANDLNEWRTALAETLPLGTGAVAVNGRRVTVQIRWSDAGDDPTNPDREERTFEYRTDL